MNQCRRPTGWLGRIILRNMNQRHSSVTDWGLGHIAVTKDATVLDIGCGGGRTVSKLAALASEGKVYGVDYSPDSAAVAARTNRQAIAAGRVEIREASVEQLPFPDHMFDVITAVETHFWWPDLPAGMRELQRVLKPGGRLILIAEIYKGAETRVAKMAERVLPLSGMKLLSVEEHRELFTSTGYEEVGITVERGKGWISAVGRKAGA